MSVTLTKIPEGISFSKNPIVFEFHSDRLLIEPGVVFSATMRFSGTTEPEYDGPAAGSVIVMEMYGSIEVFIFEPGATGENNKLPTKLSGEILTDYYERIAAAFRKNFILNNNYQIDVTEYNDTSGEFGMLRPQFVFTGYQQTESSTIYLQNTIDDFAYFSNKTNSNTPVYEKNLQVYAELYVKSVESDKRLLAATMPVDMTGKSVWDVSVPINDCIVLDAISLSDLESTLVDKDTVVYYIRYTEIFGENQTIGGFNQTDDFSAIYGGLPLKKLSGGMLSSLKNENIVDWLSYLPFEGSNLLIDQPQWLSWCNLFASNKEIVVKVKVNYTNDTFWIHTAAAVLVKAKSKITLPVSLESLGILNLFPESIIDTIEVYFQSDDMRVSPKMVYKIAYNQNPYKKVWLYKNSLGAFETLVTDGQKAYGYNLEINKAHIQKSSIGQSTQGHEVDYAVSYQDMIKVYTGYRTHAEIDLYKDFFLSAEKYMLEDGHWVAVNLDTTSVEVYKDGDMLFGLSFDVKKQSINNIWER